MSDTDTTPSISIPDELFDRHFGGGDATNPEEDIAGTTESEDEPDEDQDASPDTDEADTPDEDDESDPDSEDEGDGTGEALADGGEKKDQAAAADATFDRTELDRLRAAVAEIQDPAAKAVAEKALRQAENAVKGFQRAYTEKTTALAADRKEWTAEVQEAREWQESHREWLADLGTDEGRETFFLSILKRVPDAFSEDVLVTVAMNDPESFAAALERAQELEGDRKARRGFESDRDGRMDEHKGRQDTAARARRQEAEREKIVTDLVQDEAGKAGIRKAESLEVVRDSVDAMLARAGRDGKRVTQEDVRAHVRKVSAQLAAEKRDAKLAAERNARKLGQDRVKDEAKRARTARPAPAGSAAPGKGKGWTPPEKRSERLEALVDDYFG
jgi:hypothetical protein